MPLSRGPGRANSRATVAARRLRTELERRRAPHAKGIDDQLLYALIRSIKTTSPDLAEELVFLVAADCMTQCPRPEWLEKLVGPYPWNLEFLHPGDTADPKEWGSAGTGT